MLRQGNLIKKLGAEARKPNKKNWTKIYQDGMKNDVVVEESREIGKHKEKVAGIELAVSSLKKLNQEIVVKKVPQSHKLLQSDECKETFEIACDLEMHMEADHEIEKPFVCNMCGKKFHTSWR